MHLHLFCLGRARTHFEGKAAIFNMEAKQKQQLPTAFISNDSSSDVVCVARGHLFIIKYPNALNGDDAL